MRKAILVVLLAFWLSTPVCALPDALAEALPEELIAETEGSGVLSGGLDWLWGQVRACLDGALRGGVRSAALLTLAALICGAAEGLADGAGETAVRYVSYCGVPALSMIAAGDLHTLIGLGAQTVEELGTLSKLLLPTLAAAMAAGGYVSAASVWQVTTLMACDALSAVISGLLLPVVYCYLAASAAGAALGESRLERLADGIRLLVRGGLIAVTAAFSGYLAVAGVLTGATDRAAVKAARLAVSGAIPVVGGVLSDAAESAFAAAGALRGTVGALSIFALLSVCAAPLLRLGAQLLLYKLAAFAAGIAGPKALGEYLDRLGEAFALVFAMTASCSLMLLVALLVATTITVMG